MNLARECKRCGRSIAMTSSGHLRAHACPHGRPCVLTYAKRRAGTRVARCGTCVAAAQLALFPEAAE